MFESSPISLSRSATHAKARRFTGNRLISLGATLKDVLGYYRGAILRLKAMINRLQEKPDDLVLLKDVQLFLLERIIKTERRVTLHRRLESELTANLRHGRLPKLEAAKLKRKRNNSRRRIQEYRRLLYIWRAFGDAVLFIYLDKWSIKLLLYHDRSSAVKERPGFLDGKEGLPAELSLLTKVLADEIPAILTDLTNSIRHGDVCLLGGGDPYLLEVKSSSNENERTERQFQALQRIRDYYQNDEGFEILGLPHVKRFELVTPEVNHVAYLNSLITDAVAHGEATGEPEPGLKYVVISTHGRPIAEHLEGVCDPVVFYLNSWKSNQTWISYQPFTLLIQDPAHLYSFLCGELHVLVLVDLATMSELALERGLRFMNLDDDFAWAVERSTIVGRDEMRASKHFAARIGLECLSIKWIMDHHSNEFERIDRETNRKG